MLIKSLKTNRLKAATKQVDVICNSAILFISSMKAFRIKSALLFGFSFLLLMSCSKNDDDGVAVEKIPPIVHEDTGNFYEYTIDGAIKGIAFGKPDHKWYYSEYVGFYFAKAYDYNISITGSQKYFADNSGTRSFGIPLVVMPDSSKVPELGTYPIGKVSETLRPTDPGYSDILFTAYFTEHGSDRKFGKTADTEGSITISASGESYYEGTFEFEAFELDGPSDSKVIIKGKFRQSLPE